MTTSQRKPRCPRRSTSSSLGSWIIQRSSASSSCSTKPPTLNWSHSRSKRPRASKSSSCHSKTWAHILTQMLNLPSSGLKVWIRESNWCLIKGRTWLMQSIASPSTASPTSWKSTPSRCLSWLFRSKWTLICSSMRPKSIQRDSCALWTNFWLPDWKTLKCFSASLWASHWLNEIGNENECKTQFQVRGNKIYFTD